MKTGEKIRKAREEGRQLEIKSLNNNVCLDQDIKWHGAPRNIRKDTISIKHSLKKEEDDLVAIVSITAKPRRVTRKRLIKLLMAHGMEARGAREVVDELGKDGVPNASIYAFVVESMKEFIDEINAEQEQKEETP